MTATTIDAVLKKSSFRKVQEFGEISVLGEITKDPEEGYFRIYDRPNDNGSYLLVDSADITEKVIAISEDAANNKGFFGKTIYVVKIPISAMVYRIIASPVSLREEYVEGYGVEFEPVSEEDIVPAYDKCPARA